VIITGENVQIKAMCRKSLAQLCHQELVEKMPLFKTSMFHTVVQQSF